MAGVGQLGGSVRGNHVRGNCGAATFSATWLRAREPANERTRVGPLRLGDVLRFWGVALAAFGAQSAIGVYGASRSLRGLLAAAALFFLAAGVFPLGATSEIHIAAIATAFVLSVLAMYLFPSGAGGALSAAPRALSWSLAAGVAVSVALGHSVLPMGISQRLAALCLLAWLAILGWRLRPR